jgi:hypothetical protein
MILFKGHVSIVSPEEFTGSMLYSDGTYENNNFEFDEINLQQAMDTIHMANNNFRRTEGYGYGFLYYLVLNNGATDESCKIDPGNWLSTSRFSEWCRSELAKESARTIPIKGDLDVKLFNGTPLPIIGEDFDSSKLKEFWNLAKLRIEGTFLQLGYNHQFNK